MKQKLSFVVALWWVILCAIAGLFLVVLAEKQSHPSDAENRMLAGFPRVSGQALASGEFMSGFESFLSDGFFARNDVIELTEDLLDNFSTLSSDERLSMESEKMERQLDALGATRGSSGAKRASIDAGDAVAPAENAFDLAQMDAPEAADAADDGPDDELILDDEEETFDLDDDEPDGNDDSDGMTETDDEAENTIVTGDKIPVSASHSYIWYDLTKGGRSIIYTYENKKIKTYANTLRLMQTYLPADGVICFTQVPLASMGNRWTGQRNTYSGWGSSCEMVLEKYLEDTERIYVFNTPEILAPHMENGERMFYLTDHHWTAEAAYLVLSEMLKRQNLPVIPYDEYRYKSLYKKSKHGGMDTFNVLYPLLPGHSYVITDVDHAQEIDLMNYGYAGYLAFMNSTRQPWRRVVTGTNTGRKALVICDSFGNALAPYLLPYYDEVHMCDFRVNHFSKRDAGGTIGYMISHYKIDDVYIITSTANGLRKDNSIKFLRKYLVG